MAGGLGHVIKSLLLLYHVGGKGRSSFQNKVESFEQKLTGIHPIGKGALLIGSMLRSKIFAYMIF